MKALINIYSSVICTDRCRSFSPAITAVIPLAHHRYDVRHIQENIKEKALLNKGPSSNIWTCHRATSKEEFDIAMDEWKLLNAPAAEYANEIPHHFWTTYPVVAEAVPYMLFSFTGSQAVEQEMARFKRLKIRHALPLKSVQRYVNLFAELVDGGIANAAALRNNTGKKLTDFATLAFGQALSASYQYKAKELVGPRLYGPVKTYEISNAEGGPVRTVQWPVSLDEAKSCNCHEAKLTGLPCHHMMSCYKLRYTTRDQSPEHLLNCFRNNVASFYWKENYCHGYIESVVKPNFTYLKRGTTVAPAPVVKKGPDQTNRHKSRLEGGTGSSKSSRAIA
jgi:hypothetical protein